MIIFIEQAYRKALNKYNILCVKYYKFSNNNQQTIIYIIVVQNYIKYIHQ